MNVQCWPQHLKVSFFFFFTCKVYKAHHRSYTIVETELQNQDGGVSAEDEYLKNYFINNTKYLRYVQYFRCNMKNMHCHIRGLHHHVLGDQECFYKEEQ